MLLSIIDWLLSAVDILILAPVCIVSTEILVAVLAQPNEQGCLGERHQIAVLVPAHDESSTIADTLRAIRPQLADCDRLLVVADNCSDDTAEVARTEGAEVIERTNLLQRGKGFALDFGLRHLERHAPGVVIIIDADCRVSPGSIDRLARTCDSYARPVQALYLMRTPYCSSARMRIAEFSWLVKNFVRPSGLHRMGFPCHLMGSGMAFPWNCIRVARLATGHIVEDLKLGIDMARDGTPPMFCPDALVTSEFPESAEGVATQRTRWEHGHLSLILSDATQLFVFAISHANANLLALAVDLAVPPLSLLCLIVVSAWIASCGFFLTSKLTFPIEVSSTSIGVLALSIFSAWIRHGRAIIRVRDLAFGPFYALRKISLYAKFLVSRQTAWVRSKRSAK